MTAKSLASGGKSDITQSARAWREPLIYVVCEMLCPEERQKILSGSPVTPGRYCFKNSGKLAALLNQGGVFYSYYYFLSTN